MKPYYHHAGITIYHASCFEIVERLVESLRISDDCIAGGEFGETVVITDPPYDENTHAKARSGFRKADAIDFDACDPARVTSLLLRLTTTWALAFCALEDLGRYRDAAPSNYVRGGFWERTNGAPQFTGDRPAQPGEGIAILHRSRHAMTWRGGGRKAFYSYPRSAATGHPTPKPVQLMEQLIRDFAVPQPREGPDVQPVIVDPFCGGGTTLLAAKTLGFRAVGVELDERYCEIAARRMAQEVLFT